MKVEDNIVFFFSDLADKFKEISFALFFLKDNNFVKAWIPFNKLPVRCFHNIRDKRVGKALSQGRNCRGGHYDITDKAKSNKKDLFYIGRINPLSPYLVQWLPRR